MEELYPKGTRCPASRNIDADVLCFRYSSLIKFFWTENKVLSMTRLSWIERLSFTLAKNIYFYPSAYLLFYALLVERKARVECLYF